MDTKLDLTFAQVVTKQIEDYVYAEVLFYPVNPVGGLQLPPLTIGNWLETDWRLTALGVSDPSLDAARAEVQRVRTERLDLYQNKARREFKSRIDTWTLWLSDQGNAANIQRAYGNDPAYPTQVHVRFKLELLKDHVPQPDIQLARLIATDDDLRRHSKPGTFVWDKDLIPAAPKDKYWWLYGA